MLVFENEVFCLKLNDNCCAESLMNKRTGEECLKQGQNIPFFSISEQRPYNNEIKLAYPNKRMTFHANRVRKEKNDLIVGFELVEFEAVVSFEVKENYISFFLKEFIVKPEHFGILCMDTPPVESFRMLQLPIARRERFGEWLGVSWDDKVAVNVCATSPEVKIDYEKRDGFDIFYAETFKSIQLTGCSAVLIASETDEFLNTMEKVETDYNLPSGVKSRRSEMINASSYWVIGLAPDNVDMHIKYAKEGGFRTMLIHYSSVVDGNEAYWYLGNYALDDKYGDYNGLKEMLDKIKAAGITPGIHTLHSHIGQKSIYVSPSADHRLNIKNHFSLARDVEQKDDVIYVEQNPQAAPMHDNCRVLKFDGELITYEGYESRWPYCFTGCKRGYFGTTVTEHKKGIIGGILDVSEYGKGGTVYIDQNTSLQDEVAEKIARVYNQGFEFIYLDGSEGTNAPYEYHIPNAQYKVYKRLEKEPLFCEGAARSHFSWHMMAGGNAFDVFPTEIFKESIARYPLQEAPRMANDFTRINFGWWKLYNDTQPDTYEYGTSRAAAWDCPATVQIDTKCFDENPRIKDVLQVMNRWEEIRRLKLLTGEQKEALKNPDQEHILLVNEKGEFELREYDRINAACGDKDISAFVLERNNKVCVVCWCPTGNARFVLPLNDDSAEYREELGGEKVKIERAGGNILIPINGRRYFTTDLPREIVIKAFEKGTVVK